MHKGHNRNCTCNQFNQNKYMNLKVINRGKRNMKIMLVKKNYQKKNTMLDVKWITIVYVLVVWVYRFYMRSLGRLMCNYVSVGLEG
jgi:hypothetical protein